MAHIIQWFRQVFCKHEFEIYKQGELKHSYDKSWKYKPTWVTIGHWTTYVCKKCLYKYNVDTN